MSLRIALFSETQERGLSGPHRRRAGTWAQEHIVGRGWYGLRRIAADLAESATTDDRVKDRLGG